MRKKILLALLALSTITSLGLSDTFSFRYNYFVPTAQSGPKWPDSLWTIEFDNMDYTKLSFQGGSFSFSYELFLDKVFSLVFSIDSYSKTQYGYYKDYVGYSFDEGDFAFPNDYEGDFTPGHSLKLSITPIQVSLVCSPFGRRGKLIPYIGAGIGYYFWSVTMRGDMIDFSDLNTYTDPDFGDVTVFGIWPVDAKDSGKIRNFSDLYDHLGVHILGGLTVPVANKLNLNAELKYSYAKGIFTESFVGFDTLDLCGFQFSFGINYRF